MFYNSSIKKIEIEVSSKCNAKCPHYLRESRNGDYSFFNQVNLTEAFFKEKFSEEFIKNLQSISFVGVMGEPAMNKELPNIIKWLKNCNSELAIDICTNGGVQKPEWWIELGNLLKYKGRVVFAIDGLEDTNHIYRINVKWNMVLENIKSYISTGAIAEWQFIPFKHNEHQIDICRSLSKELGFNKFFIKISHRDLTNQPQHEKNKIENSEDPQYRHPGVPLDFTNMDAVENYLNSVNIDCYSISTSYVYLSAEGLLYPCCHTAGLMQMPEKFLPEGYTWVTDANNAINKNEISLYKNNINDIIKSKTFIDIKNSWAKTVSIGRNPVCSIICGKTNNTVSIKDVLRKTNKN